MYQTLKENEHNVSQCPSAPIASDGAGPSIQTSEDPTTTLFNHDSVAEQTIVIPSAEEVQNMSRHSVRCQFLQINSP